MVGLVELLALLLTGGSGQAIAGAAASGVPTGRSARTADYQVNRWSDHEGLPQATVSEIEGSSDGFLYLATFGGLVRFDGSAMRVLPGLPGAKSLSYRPTALAADDAGGVWVGLERGGLVYWDGTTLRGVDTPELLHNTVWDLAWHPDRGLLVGGQEGLGLLQGDTWSLPKSPQPDGPQAVHAVSWDGAGVAWVGSDHGLDRLGVDGVREQFLETSDIGAVLALEVDQAGRLWMGVHDRIGLAAPDGISVGAPLGLGQDHIWDLESDASGALWIAGSDGLLRAPSLEVLADQVRENTPVDAQLLAHETARSLRLAPSGTMWVGSVSEGLFSFAPHRYRRFDEGAGVVGGVGAVVGDGQGGIWFTTDCDVLSELRDGTARRVPLELPPGRCVTSLAMDSKGALWVATEDGATQHRVSADGMEVMQTITTEAPGRALAIAPDGTVWIGTDGGGLVRWRDGKRSELDTSDGLGDDTITVVRLLEDGSMWLGHPSGSTLLQADRTMLWGEAEGHPPGEVRDIQQSPDGAIWIATYGGGLARLHDGAFSRLTRADGLFDDAVSRILWDDAGNLWLNSNRGVSVASSSSLGLALDGGEPLRIGIFDSGEGNGTHRPAGWKDERGQLWFPTIDGLVSFDPKRAFPEQAVATVAVDSFKEGGVELPRDGSAIVGPGPIDLRVTFTAPALEQPRLTGFEYRLDEGPWQSTEGRRDLHLFGAEPGPHLLELRATSSGNASSPSVAALSFYMREPPSSSSWFKVLLGIVCVVFVGLLVRLSTQSWRGRVEELEHELTTRLQAQEVLLVEQRERLNHVQQLADATRLESIGQLAGGVAHDFHNLLTVSGTYTHLLRDQLDPRPGSDIEEFLDGLEATQTQAGRLTQQLLAFGRRQRLAPEIVDLRKLLEEMLPNLSRLGGEDILLRFEADDHGHFALVDPARLQQGVIGLVTYAMSTMPFGGEVDVSLKWLSAGRARTRWPDTRATGDQLCIEISDTGPGISADSLPFVFEPFSPPAGAGSVSGLELAAVHGFIEQSEGYMRVESPDDRGARFVIMLPARRVEESSAGAEPSERRTTLGATNSVVVLVCDDVSDVRRSMVTLLRAAGYRVLEASGGEDALRQLSRPELGIDLLVTDVKMPDLSGDEVVLRIRVDRPDLPVLFVSGYVGEAEVDALLDQPNTHLLSKPFRPSDLVEWVARLWQRSEACKRIQDQGRTTSSPEARSV